MSGYLSIAEHGLVADLHSLALVGTERTIDWSCCPRFDSPSVLAAILGAERGGRYRLRRAVAAWTTKQLYCPDSNVPGPGMPSVPAAPAFVSALGSEVAARESERLRRMPGAAA